MGFSLQPLCSDLRLSIAVAINRKPLDFVLESNIGLSPQINYHPHNTIILYLVLCSSMPLVVTVTQRYPLLLHDPIYIYISACVLSRQY